jgi:hypothetical protein
VTSSRARGQRSILSEKERANMERVWSDRTSSLTEVLRSTLGDACCMGESRAALGVFKLPASDEADMIDSPESWLGF